MDNKELAYEVAGLLDKKKADDVVIIDISEKSSFSDFLVIASAGSERQTEALSDDVEDLMAKLGVEERASEGKRNTGWVLLDYGDIIINIFSTEMRDKYDLEKVWGDCELFRVETED
jgi:ribosome-associated protein